MRPGALVVAMLVIATSAGAVGQAAAASGGERSTPPKEEHVEAWNEYFSPGTVVVARGGTVIWDFVGDASHTATDGTGMGLYDSDIVHPGGASYPYTFVAAGTYAFVCTLHVGMDGEVGVPIRAAPARGALGRTFMVTWSSAEAPAGVVFDVRVQRRGHDWRTWQDGVTQAFAGFRPTRKGTYRLLARMRRSSSGAASGWSEAAVIEVA